MARGTDGACDRMSERARTSSWKKINTRKNEKKGRRTSLDDTATGADVKTGEDKGDVCEIEDLGAMRESEGPKLWGGAEEVYKAIAGARADL